MRIVDRCGRFLSSIVYNNIALLIAIGILRILFSPQGWIPHDEFYSLVNPMMMYVIPIMFAFTGGKSIGDFRGGMSAVFVTMSVIMGSEQEYPMILAALLIGPTMGYVDKLVGQWIERHIPIGFELLIQNVVSALVAVIMALLSYWYIAPTMELVIKGIMIEMQLLIQSSLLPLLSIIIEPGKVLFFNNVMNHGILEPLGMSQLKHNATSIFFMIESNPGPGFGVLLALYLWRKKEERSELKAAIPIQFLGGIHEVYFPFVLMKPILLIPLIIGGMLGIFVFATFGAGLVATPSPGSILIYLAMTPRQSLLTVILGVVTSILASFSLSYLLLKWTSKKSDNLISIPVIAKTSSNEEVGSLIHEEITATSSSQIYHVVFACDGGLASSAMGAAKLKKLLKAYPQHRINVTYSSVDRIPKEADLVVLQQYLQERLIKTAAEATYLFVQSLVEPTLYDQLLDLLVRKQHGEPALNVTENSQRNNNNYFAVSLDIEMYSHEEAVRTIADKLYEWGMLSRSCRSLIYDGERMPLIIAKHGIAIISNWELIEGAIQQEGIAIIRLKQELLLNCGNETKVFIIICGDLETRMNWLPQIASIIEDHEQRHILFNGDESQLEALII